MTKLPFFLLLLLLAITVPSSYASIGYGVEDDDERDDDRYDETHYVRGYEIGFERGYDKGYEQNYANRYPQPNLPPCDYYECGPGIISPTRILVVTIAGIIAASVIIISVVFNRRYKIVINKK